MCEHLGRCSVPSAYNTSAGSAAHSHHDLNERMRRGRGNWISRPPDLNRGNGKHQSDRNQATGRKLQVGKLDSRADLGCLTVDYTLSALALFITVVETELNPLRNIKVQIIGPDVVTRTAQ